VKQVGMLAVLALLLFFFAPKRVEGGWQRQEPDKEELIIVKGKVFRSDMGKAIPNAYILLTRERDSPAQAEHVDLRTDENGNFRFTGIPVGEYSVSISAWFPQVTEAPCQSPSKITEDGHATVEWQWKSQAFMETVTIRGFAVRAGQETVKDFDLVCK
jgi:Carboxypeptidase regulatory-like domain